MGQILCPEASPPLDNDTEHFELENQQQQEQQQQAPQKEDFVVVEQVHPPPDDTQKTTEDLSMDDDDPLPAPSNQEASLPPLPVLPVSNVDNLDMDYLDATVEDYDESSSQLIPPESCYHSRSKSEGLILSLEDANRLHASWSNAQDLPATSAFSPASTTSFQHTRHSTEPRLGSLSLSMEDPDQTTTTSTVSSVIHDAARITNWKTVKLLCGADPEAASYVGRDRWTALHHACNRRCPYPDVVEALIGAYPDALLQEEDKGWLPLHYACRFKAAKDVVRLLLRMDPIKGRTAVTRLDRQGRTPLYYAVRYDAPPGVVGLLLEVDATAVLEEDQNADSPLALVWDAWAEKLDGKRTLQRIYVPNDEAETMSRKEQAAYVRKRLEGQIKLHERWVKVNIFLKAAFGFSVEDDDSDETDNFGEEKKDGQGLQDSANGPKWRMLHATAAIKCHPSLFMLAQTLYPEQAFEIDNKDLRGPIHISGDQHAASNLTPLHLAASSRANGESGKLVIHELLKLNPDAATAVDTEDSLALHRFVENKYKPHWFLDGARDLYLANTAAVHAVDMNGKLPLHRASRSITYIEYAIDEQVARSRSVICNLLELHPDGASHADNFGCLPLHLVAQHGSEWDYQVQALYDAYPSAAQSRTGVKLLNRLPLHMAAANPKSVFSLIVTLIRINPRGASQADRRGKYPLHLACESGLSWESINVIHNAYPEAVRQPEQNARGWTALQMAAACLTNADGEVISNLARIYPEAAAEADSDGCCAFHLACLAGKKWDDGLSSLFDANPDAVRTPDHVGLLPFHIVSFRYSSPPPKSPLSRPAAVSPKNRGFSRAASFDMEQSVLKEQEDAKRLENLFHLLKADPTVLSTH
jgi:ankyrin repeat protein